MLLQKLSGLNLVSHEVKNLALKTDKKGQDTSYGQIII